MLLKSMRDVDINEKNKSVVEANLSCFSSATVMVWKADCSQIVFKIVRWKQYSVKVC